MNVVVDVFLSYSKKDGDRITALRDSLESAGLTVWWDHRIPPGESYITWILSRLRASDCVIVLWSSSSITSEWVISEAEEARVRRVLLPVFIDEVVPPPPFNLLNGVQLSNWDGDPDDPQWGVLLETAKRHAQRGSPGPDADEEPAATVAPEPTEAQTTGTSPTLPVSPGAAALVAETESVKRDAHPYLGLHHWMLALLDKHPGMVERLQPGIDGRSLEREIDRTMRADDDFGEALSIEQVMERADVIARSRGADKVWESDIAAAILEAGVDLIDR